MNATTEPQPVCKCPATACRCRHSAVSDKDRDAAIEAVASELGKDRGYSCLDFPDAASDAVAALVAHGWGPRPTVSRADVSRIAADATVPDIAYEHTVFYLSKLGIEVTDE